jgi:hypothetical protein
LKQIGRYLKATCNPGLIIKPSSSVLKIDAYPDANFAEMYGYERHDDPSCVKIWTGYVINDANYPVMWQSKLQTETAFSTMEAEIVAISHCAHELIPIMEMVELLGPAVGLPVDCTSMHREDVVAELILIVNPLYRIMSVAMLNYERCLALRSVLGTSGVWPK